MKKIADKKAVKVVPEEFGVVFDAAETMECLPRKIPVPRDGGRKTFEFPVTPSRLDPNGHMTSAEYLGLAADRLQQEAAVFCAEEEGGVGRALLHDFQQNILVTVG